MIECVCMRDGTKCHSNILFKKKKKRLFGTHIQTLPDAIPAVILTVKIADQQSKCNKTNAFRICYSTMEKCSYGCFFFLLFFRTIHLFH